MGSIFNFSFNKHSDSLSDPKKEPQELSAISQSDFEELRNFIYNECGIYFNDSKKYLLENKILKRIKYLQLNTLKEYTNLLKSDNGRIELNGLFEAITINETYFFRAIQQFEALEKIIIPSILKNQEGAEKKVFRIWSSASSTGEEAYTIAILLKERIMPLYPNIRFQILASDIDKAVLEQAKKGIYADYSVRNIPKEYYAKYFTKDKDKHLLSGEIKRMVKFMNINLYDTGAMSSINNCDVIFCCNVLIYFDINSKKKVVMNLHKSLVENGLLIVGYSESLHGVTKDFRLIHLPRVMVYKKI